MTFTDRILSNFGLARTERIKAAYRRGRQTAFRDYAGAAINRLTSDWISSVISIQQDIRSNLVTLRERGRDLAKNNPIVARWLNLCTANIVGPNGFTFQSDVKELVEDPKGKSVKLVADKVANMKIEEGFRDRTKPQHCSVNGKLSFRQICSQVVEYKKRDGEAFIRKVVNGSKYGFQLHIIAPEALDEKKNDVLANGNVVLMGIELDKWRRPVNYYFKNIDPYLELFSAQTYTTEHIVIPASQIIHYYKQQYENQTRGITELSNVMLMLRHLYGYDEATVVAARLAASKSVVYETDPNNATEYKGDSEDADGNYLDTLEPGSSTQLPPGVKAHLLDPTQPSNQYSDYQKATLKKVSAGLDVAYASLSNDLSEGSYGSNRVGLLDERSQWQMEQQDFIDNVLSQNFPDWLNMALLKVLNLPAEKFEKFNKPNWVGRTWDWIDPLKDVSASVMQLQSGLASPWDIAAQRGADPITILEDLAEWQAKAKELGVTLALYKILINTGDSAEETKVTTKTLKPTNGVHTS